MEIYFANLLASTGTVLGDLRIPLFGAASAQAAIPVFPDMCTCGWP